MIFEKNKYQGEIWIPGLDDKKYFCILTIVDDEILLETNLHKPTERIKIEEIHGAFNGLAFLTFINSRVRNFGSGVVQSRVYNPEFTFVSDSHFINGRKLKIKEFVIENSAIVDWYAQTTFLYNTSINEIERIAEDLDRNFNLKLIGLKINLQTFSSYRSTDQGIDVINKGSIKFISDNELTIFEAINIYDKFQKFLHFVHGNSNQFNQFSFKCLGCEEWKHLYYKNKLKGKKYSNFLTFRYKELSVELEKIFEKWFVNDELIYCIDMILENQLSIKISHTRKFINSIFALEAFYKRFSDNSHKKLNRILPVYTEIFKGILEKEEKEVNDFITNIIIARDYFVHSNIKQRSPFTDFELLYISLLIDYVLAIEVLKFLNVSEENIEKVRMWAENAYHNQQRTNYLLNQNILLE